MKNIRITRLQYRIYPAPLTQDHVWSIFNHFNAKVAQQTNTKILEFLVPRKTYYSEPVFINQVNLSVISKADLFKEPKLNAREMYKVDEVWGDGPSNDLTDDTDNRSNSDSVDGKYKYEHRLEIVSDSQHKKDLEQSHQDAIESVSNDVITVDESNDHADYVDPNTFPQTLTIDNMTLKLFSFKNIENKGDKVLPDPINFEVEKVDI